MPLIKIGYLFIRTISKPISSMIKRQAREHPMFRKVCTRSAQLYHRIDVRMRRKLALKTNTKKITINSTNNDIDANVQALEAEIKPLDEQKAIDLGAEFIGEAVVFGIAGILLVLEAARSHRAEIGRRRLIEEKFEQLFTNNLEINEQVKILQRQMTEIQNQPLQPQR